MLQALDIFFNQDKIDKSFVRDLTKPVEIGILFNKVFYKKIYNSSSYKLTITTDNISSLDLYKYIYIPISAYDPKVVITQLSVSKAKEKTPKKLLEQLKKFLKVL